MRKFDVLTGAALAAVLLAPLPVLAADASGEIVTAITHVELSSHTTDLAAAKMHLHHTLNCLVGAGGDGFDPKSLNPCANAGSGAIPDTADAARKAKLNAAAVAVRQGLAAATLADTAAKATAAAGDLRALEPNTPPFKAY